MNEQQKLIIKKYLNVLVRRRAVILISLFLFCVLGLGYFYITPKVYRASALLIYQKQKVSPSKMSPDIQSNTHEIVSTLMQQVTSRQSLEKIIKDFDLYPELVKKFPFEDVIEVMRLDIQIRPTKGDIFEVSYEGNDPKKVLKVTNALSSKFIEENLKYREEKATETSEYIKNELALAKKNIDQKEAAMRDYKLKYYNEMPEQREMNVYRLNGLQTKLQGVQDNIQELERTKLMVNDQLSSFRDKKDEEDLVDFQENGSLGITQQEHLSDEEKIAYLRAQLEILGSKYKEGHPKMKRIRQLIAGLEKNLKERSTNVSAPDAKILPQNSGIISQKKGDKREELKLQIKSIELSLLDLREEVKKLKLQIEKIEQWIAATPVREAEWSSLTRDYDELKRHYDYLVAQNLQAASVENLERKQKGSQFKIMDPARLPEKPSKPNFIKIMFLAVILGLGIGGGLIFGLDFMDSSFRDPFEIEEYLGLPVSCSVPILYTEKEKRLQKTRLFIEGGTILIGIIFLIAIVWYLWKANILIL